MDLERIKNIIKRQDGLSNTLGMEFISTPESGTYMVRTKVDDSNKQVSDSLSGGATLALAKNLAGVGSMTLCPDKICMGINVSSNHVRPVMEGDIVAAYDRLQRKGNTLHQWHIEIKDQNSKFISIVQVTNSVVREPKK